MECNMIKNGLRMVRGNAFSLRIKVRAYRIDGTEIGDFVLNPLTDTLLLTSSSTVRPLAFSVEDGSTNNAVVSFGAAMQAGYYGLDFSGVWDGVAWRFSAKNVFQIVELTAQGNVPKDGVIYDDTYDTHAEVTLTSQSVQSDWAQNDPTNPAYIRNKPEIYTKAEINVLLDNIYTKSEVDGLISDEEERAKAAEKANADDIEGIEEKIPSGASSQNKLVDQQTMNSSIATATATYRGAYNLVSDLELTTAATEQQIAAALATVMAAATPPIVPDNNDYCYVQVPTSDATPTEIARVDRYKYNGTAWGFEYSLNNSGFTAAQWAALNSGITSELVTKLSDLPTYTELMTLLGGKEDKSNKVTSLSAESTDTQYPSAKCVYDLHKANADDIDGIEEKIPSGASSQNKLVDQQTMNSSIATASATYRGAYNLVSDLSLTVSATKQQIAAALATVMAAATPPIVPDNNDYCYVQVPTSDATPTQIARVDRYKYNGAAWGFEYSLNNSGFTAAQWAALNSGITSGLVAKLYDLPTNSELTTLLAGKQNTINDLSDIRSGAAKGETAYQKPVGGIPSEDMSSGVQSSLQKAEDAAPQSTTYNKTEVDGIIGGIEEKIPSGASSQNKLVDQQTMNSSIATATATYRGAYNLVSDLSLTVSATEQQIAAALATVMAAATPPIVPDNNDYCYVQVPTSDATPTQIARVDRYKYNGTAWGFEYALNNSGFTAAQWAALNSGITSGLVAKLSDLPTNSELTTLLAGKQDVISDLSDIRSGAAKGETAYQKPVGGIPSEDMSSGVQSSLQKAEDAAPQSTTYNKTEVDGMIGGIEEKIPSGASSQNKLVDQQTMNSSIATATATYRGAYNLVSDLELTVAATEQQIAAALATVMAAATPPIVPDNNDYCFVQIPTADATPTVIARVDRYKFNGTAWGFEYSLNNSGFTAAQWAALNSGITSGLVTKLSDLPTNSELTTLLAGKQAVISDLQTIREGAAAGAAAAPQITTYTKTEVDNLLAGKQAIINDRAIIGDGSAVCNTAGDTPQKEITITDFLLIKNGVVSVRFANAITVASPTLKINDNAAKAIYLNGAAVQPGWILAGMTVNMRYNGTQFDIISMIGPEKTDDELLVDMGLPSGLLWSTRNIDVKQANGFAASPYQYECSFFSWGNTDGHNPTAINSFAPYSWGNANTSEPYTSSPGAALTASFGLSFDAAFANLGNQWRMPTTEEFAELFNNIDYINPDGTVIETTQANKLVTVNGVVGILLKSKNNSRTLFFPCSGYGNGQSWVYRGSYGLYWSSSLGSATYGRYLYFYSGGVDPQYYSLRFYGFSVRPVQNLLSPAQ